MAQLQNVQVYLIFILLFSYLLKVYRYILVLESIYKPCGTNICFMLSCHTLSNSLSTLSSVIASLVMVIGQLLNGSVLGNIASTLANEEAGRVEYEERLDAVKVKSSHFFPPSSSSEMFISMPRII